MVEQSLYHQCNGGTNTVPPLVSTNNHISQIFLVVAAPMYWWDWLAAPVPIVLYVIRGIVMLAAPALINRTITILIIGLECWIIGCSLYPFYFITVLRIRNNFFLLEMRILLWTQIQPFWKRNLFSSAIFIWLGKNHCRLEDGNVPLVPVNT